jgi:hypothetical protein
MPRPVPPPCSLLPQWTTRLRSVVGVALLGLPSCTPVTHAGSTFDWVVTNQTADTLRIGVRYPLDSSQVSPTDLPHLRRQWFADSAVEHGLGYRRHPLTRLVQHAGHWYYVQPQAWPVATHDDAHGPRRWAQVNRLAGTVTYALPPHGTQSLTQTICLPCDTIPLPRLVGLWLEQGAERHTLVPGRPLRQLFHVVPTGQEHDYSARALYELRVGPGLALLESDGN